MTQLDILRLGHRGDGIAEGPVYVPGALPGETVSGELEGDILRDMRIVTPSAHRVSPPCRHAKACGGCQVQHASETFVADWKMDVVRRALDAQGLNVPLRGPLTSPSRSRRRASLSVRRTKAGALAGFHRKASAEIIAVPDCMVIADALRDAIPLVEALAQTGGSRKGELTAQVTQTEGGLDVAVTGGKPVEGALWSELVALTRDWPVARLSWDGEVVVEHHPPLLQFDGIAITLPPGAFLQATQDGEAALRREVTRIVGDADRVVDLFAGCGTFALPLARGAEVHAVENDRAALAALDRGWRQAQGLKRVTTQVRDLFRAPLVPEELKGIGAAVIDPPRAGAEAQVAQLGASDIRRIAHVSCNPVTFARDCAALIGAGFTLEDVCVVDQFRWSTHVEVVGTLLRD